MNRKCLFVYDTDILAPFRVSKNKQTSCIIPNEFDLKSIKTSDLSQFHALERKLMIQRSDIFIHLSSCYKL